MLVIYRTQQIILKFTVLILFVKIYKYEVLLYVNFSAFPL